MAEQRHSAAAEKASTDSTELWQRSARSTGVIGDFNEGSDAHRATNDAVKHAADALGVTVQVEWIPTLDLESVAGGPLFQRFHGLWCAPGSPYQSMSGALDGIRVAREHRWPFFGT